MLVVAEPSEYKDEEAVFSKALQIRAQELEKLSGFKFDKNTKPKTEFEWILGRTGSAARLLIVAEYESETQTIYFVSRLIAETTVRHKTLLKLANPAVISEDGELGELFDHELGHLLMDQVSRRNKLGPWFTAKRFLGKELAEQLGINIVSEGTAMYFQRIRHSNFSKLSEAVFPADLDQWRYYSFTAVAYEGGFWLVRDVLKKHGERGLAWLIAHPFLATDNMREAAVLYRKTALHELEKKPK